MKDPSRFAGFFNPARWGYDAIVQIERDGQDGYAKSPKKMVNELRQALNSMKAGIRDSGIESEEQSSLLQPFCEEEDIRKENQTFGYRNKRKAIAFLMLALMSIASVSVSLFKLRLAR